MAVRWRVGFVEWQRDMLKALDRISILVSTQTALATLDDPHSQLRATLTGLEQTLGGCATRVVRLGPEPSAEAMARGYALEACASLEQGDRLLESAVAGLGDSAGLDGAGFVDASGPLSDGQNEMAVAVESLGPAPARCAGEHGASAPPGGTRATRC